MPDSTTCAPAGTSKACQFTQRQLAAAFQRGPALAWNGTGYAGAWFDFDQSATHFISLDERGKPLSEVRSLEFSYYGGPAMLAADASYDFAIADSSAIAFLSIARAGTDLDPNATPARRDVASSQSMPSQVQLIAAPATDGYAVVWRTGASNAGVTHVARIANDGALRGTHVLGQGGDHHSPRAVWTGDGFAVAWSHVEAGQTRIRFLELDAAGMPKSSEAATLATIEKNRSYPELVWTGEQVVIAWLSGSLTDDTGKTHLVRLSRGGQRVGPEIEVTGYFAGLASIGDGIALLTYVNERGRDLVQITTAIGDVTTPSTVQLTLMNPELQVFSASGFKQDLGVNEFGRPLVWDGQSLTFLWGGDHHVSVGQFTCQSTPLL